MKRGWTQTACKNSVHAPVASHRVQAERDSGVSRETVKDEEIKSEGRMTPSLTFPGKRNKMNPHLETNVLVRRLRSPHAAGQTSRASGGEKKKKKKIKGGAFAWRSFQHVHTRLCPRCCLSFCAKLLKHQAASRRTTQKSNKLLDRKHNFQNKRF